MARSDISHIIIWASSGVLTTKFQSIMGCGSLGNFIVLLRLDSMHQIWEFDPIVNEKYGHIVGNQVVISFSANWFCLDFSLIQPCSHLFYRISCGD